MTSLVTKAMLAAALAALLPVGAQEPAPKTTPASPQAQEPKPKTESAKPSTPAKPKGAKPKPKVDPATKTVLGPPNPKAPLTPTPAQKVPLPSTKKAPKIPYEKRLNLNAASREELMKLPTVDAATADRIIAGRPYKVTAELLIRNVVPGAHFYTVKDLVTAGKYTPPGKK
jgi:DNA uptake protein ComE-like DNA-binding protein